MNIIDEISGKKVLIWGYGREGKSTENFIQRCCPYVKYDVYEGKNEGIHEEDYDIIIKSPGIIMEKDNPKYTSQTELFLQQFGKRVIGITGTKGKSTTSSMLYKVLKDCGNNVILLGNIGCPCLDYYEEITDDTIIVFEMSCHQLMHTLVSPHIAVFLNLYEEHLDYYGNISNYFNAKSNITKHQTPDDYFWVGENVPDIDTKAKVIKVENKKEYDFSLGIIGKHNQYNAEFVYRIATELFFCDAQTVKESLSSFSGLPHRLEYIGTVDDIDFYDDSISTIPLATINAVRSIQNVQTILIGGMDRQINYDILIDFIHNNQKLLFICSYASGKRIFESSKESKNCLYTENLREAVYIAKKLTKKGNACVLSPAAASYGYFKNFEERGNRYKEYVFNCTKDN